ncbi:hypothetical protein NP493_697g00009 [Ridgeia piscesae]|uniref:Uncharacterized protein n=1 Tax=Ridgeia piscesae TaxID=27915 RepID=A0AAD9KQL9_RIDPI|nr:hypothetical protein NP493_697g00009 [Ridgeia piscesae]
MRARGQYAATTFLFTVCLSLLLSLGGSTQELLLEPAGSGEGDWHPGGEADRDIPSDVFDSPEQQPAVVSAIDDEVDIVDNFLRIVERYERNKDNCTPGTTFSLGPGVVAQYGVRRFKAQAMVAVNRANFLTRIWKGARPQLLDSEYFFYTSVREMVEGDPVLFAAGNCYDYKQYKDYVLFCPYAYRMHDNPNKIMVKDLSLEYKYLGNDSEFFYQARVKAHRKLAGPFNDTDDEYLLAYIVVCHKRCPHLWHARGGACGSWIASFEVAGAYSIDCVLRVRRCVTAPTALFRAW